MTTTAESNGKLMIAEESTITFSYFVNGEPLEGKINVVEADLTIAAAYDHCESIESTAEKEKAVTIEFQRWINDFGNQVSFSDAWVILLGVPAAYTAFKKKQQDSVISLMDMDLTPEDSTD